jgi:hypothetical protein
LTTSSPRSWSSKLTDRLALLRRIGGPRDAALLAQVLPFAATVPLLLRLPLENLANLVEPCRRRATPAGEAVVNRIVRTVDAAIDLGSPVVRGGCLTLGLTRYYFLRRAGIDVTLHFGISDPSGDVVAHCWLTRAGEPYLEGTDPRPLYRVMYSFPPARGAA